MLLVVVLLDLEMLERGGKSLMPPNISRDQLQSVTNMPTSTKPVGWVASKRLNIHLMYAKPLFKNQTGIWWRCSQGLWKSIRCDVTQYGIHVRTKNWLRSIFKANRIWLNALRLCLFPAPVLMPSSVGHHLKPLCRITFMPCRLFLHDWTGLSQNDNAPISAAWVAIQQTG